MYVNYRILWDTHDDNTLAIIVEALILWGVTKVLQKKHYNMFKINKCYIKNNADNK